MGLKRKKRCKVTLGTTYVVDGKDNFPCEREPHGDEWHERWSPPVAARWRELEGGGRQVEMGHSESAG